MTTALKQQYLMLGGFFEQLEKQLNYAIVTKCNGNLDYTDRLFRTTLVPYTAHFHPYCLYVKSRSDAAPLTSPTRSCSKSTGVCDQILVPK